ncbi:MAG: F0F1 ATP synthase subunit epsilon [Spirochaetales bacterium]|jgi:F-type H+-transporting ATPase subunit epsilon|nr:F0F1 ATP synthase subunit epsilon [Spirochaetales bacterium]
MDVTLILPHKIYYQHDEVSKLSAEGLEGHFTLLPAHIDYVSVLVPSIMHLTTREKEYFFAVDHGTLIKRGSVVKISCRNAVEGEDINQLARVVTEKFKEIDEMEKKARTALLGLEYGVLRGFSKLGKE